MLLVLVDTLVELDVLEVDVLREVEVDWLVEVEELVLDVEVDRDVEVELVDIEVELVLILVELEVELVEVVAVEGTNSTKAHSVETFISGVASTALIPICALSSELVPVGVQATPVVGSR